MQKYLKNNNYEFLIDWFSFNLNDLHPFILVNKDKIKDVLEIGSWEGMSACYFLDNLELNTLTCIDPFFENSYEKFLSPQQLEGIKNFNLNQFERFNSNIFKTTQQDKVKVYKNFSENILPSLQENSFDFIFIDGLHSCDQVDLEVKYCFNLLKNGGFILFDDYTCVQSLKEKIDELVIKYSLKVILSYRQLLVQKI